MSRCKGMAYTNDPSELVIRCELEEHERGSHASKKDLAAMADFMSREQPPSQHSIVDRGSK